MDVADAIRRALVSALQGSEIRGFEAVFRPPNLKLDEKGAVVQSDITIHPGYRHLFIGARVRIDLNEGYYGKSALRMGDRTKEELFQYPGASNWAEKFIRMIAFWKDPHNISFWVAGFVAVRGKTIYSRIHFQHIGCLLSWSYDARSNSPTDWKIIGNDGYLLKHQVDEGPIRHRTYLPNSKLWIFWPNALIPN